ncbi:hypothetical protein BpHYR1_045904 [Brachionus plicatilis]|uniref:Uncharacterized protein n=1 Tax=Brachionus plicatilis TaxID=10195 RepID=A0A3M7S7I0_BRAPC|nr:hypothetical protein BpHYR1_045904 [Brachionus plicatilis]
MIQIIILFLIKFYSISLIGNQIQKKKNIMEIQNFGILKLKITSKYHFNSKIKLIFTQTLIFCFSPHFDIAVNRSFSGFGFRLRLHQWSRNLHEIGLIFLDPVEGTTQGSSELLSLSKILNEEKISIDLKKYCLQAFLETFTFKHKNNDKIHQQFNLTYLQEILIENNLIEKEPAITDPVDSLFQWLTALFVRKLKRKKLLLVHGIREITLINRGYLKNDTTLMAATENRAVLSVPYCKEKQ